LRLFGYRSEHRYLVVRCPPHTVELPNEQWRVLDQAHRKRNLAQYEREVEVDAALLTAMLRVTAEVESRVVKLATTRTA